MVAFDNPQLNGEGLLGYLLIILLVLGICRWPLQFPGELQQHHQCVPWPDKHRNGIAGSYGRKSLTAKLGHPKQLFGIVKRMAFGTCSWSGQTNSSYC